MADVFQDVIRWFLALGEPYGVNPLIFGGIYVGAIPFFWLSIIWLVRNLKKGKSAVGPILAACSCAVSSYVYLIIAGQNVPFWVYVFIAAMITYGIYATLQKVRQKRQELEKEHLKKLSDET